MSVDVDSSTGAAPVGPKGALLNVVLRRSLGRFDLVMMTIAAVISVDTIGTVAAGGGTAFVAMLALVVLFLVPYGMVFAELTSTFPEEGGPYMWVRLAFGRLAGAIAVFFYWVTNPIWLGGTLAALAAATFSSFLLDLGGNLAAMWLVQAVFIWAAIAVAIVSLRRGKYVITAGAIAKLALVAVFTVTTIAYALQNGVQSLAPGFFSPTLAGFLAVAPILLFALSGFEAASGAAEEMRNPTRDMPVSIVRSGLVAAAVYLLPVLAVFAVIPAEQITGIDGFMAAVSEVFSVYGPASGVMTSAGGGDAHRRPVDPGSGVDGGHRPHAGGRRRGRSLPGLLREVQPPVRHPPAGQHRLRPHRDGLHVRRPRAADE